MKKVVTYAVLGALCALGVIVFAPREQSPKTIDYQTAIELLGPGPTNITHIVVDTEELDLRVETTPTPQMPPGYTLVCDPSNKVYTWKWPNGFVQTTIVEPSATAAIHAAWSYYEYEKRPKPIVTPPMYNWQVCDGPVAATVTAKVVTNVVALPQKEPTPDIFKVLEQRDLQVYRQGAGGGAILAFGLLSMADGAYLNSQDLESDVRLVVERLIVEHDKWGTNLPGRLAGKRDELFAGTKAMAWIQRDRGTAGPHQGRETYTVTIGDEQNPLEVFTNVVAVVHDHEGKLPPCTLITYVQFGRTNEFHAFAVPITVKTNRPGQ